MGSTSKERRTSKALERGNVFFHSDNLPRAYLAYLVARTSDDLDVRALATLRIGHIRSRQDRIRGAIRAYRATAESGHPEHGPAAYFFLGETYAERARARLDDGADLANAAEAYERSTSTDHPLAPLATLNLALVREDQHDPAGAAEAYRRAIEVSNRLGSYAPIKAKAHYGLGRLCEQRGDISGAEAEYESALALNVREVERLVRRRLDELHPINSPHVKDAFRFPEYYDVPQDLSDQIDRLRSQGRHRTALDTLLDVLQRDGGSAGVFGLAVGLCVIRSGSDSAEPVTRQQLSSPYLAPIATECSACQRYWYSAHQVLPDGLMTVANAVGVQCQTCRYSLCRKCMTDDRRCPEPDCAGTLGTPVLATGRPRGLS
jgi:tetratricopeptide (TPR) repeat protein